MGAAITKDITSDLSYEKATELFFQKNTPDSVELFFLLIFQCWSTKDCNIKSGIPDKEFALFFDQLNDLVAAAYILHQANRASHPVQEGSGNS